MSQFSSKGTFAANTTTGNQSVTGLPGQPKFVILWTSGETTPGTSGSGATNRTCRGFGVSSTQRCCTGITSVDNTSTGEVSWNESAIIELVDVAGTDYALADLVSLDANGFTINWTTAPTAAVVIHYLAVGGSDITNAACGAFASNSSGGSGVTNVISSLSFQPSAAMFLSTGVTAAGLSSTVSPQASFGCATGTAEFACHVTGIFDSTKCVYGNTSSKAAGLTSFSSNGFTLTWGTAPTVAVRIGYLAWQGGNVYIGTDTEPTTNTSQSKTGMGFHPSGVLLAGPAGLASGGKATWFMGATDGTNTGCTAIAAASATPVRSVVNYNTTGIASMQSISSGTPQDKGDGAVSSLDSGGYTLNWTNTDGTARTFGVLAVGATVVQTLGPRILGSYTL